MSNTSLKKIDFVTLPKQEPKIYFLGNEPKIFTEIEKEKIKKGLKLEISEQIKSKKAFYSKAIKLSYYSYLLAQSSFFILLLSTNNNDFLKYLCLFGCIFSLLSFILFTKLLAHTALKNLIEKIK